MREWVLVGSIGPVGAFVASGRRSRDLWWGSTWVSECSLAVAKRLARGGPEVEVTMILPTRGRMEEVESRFQRDRYGQRINNRILARVVAPSADAVRALAEECRREANSHLAEKIEHTEERAGGSHGLVRSALDFLLDRRALDRQLDAIRNGDFVETYFAWSPWEETSRGSRSSIERADDLLTARKSARLFREPEWTRAGFRRSDLDAGRDSVFRPTPEAGPGGKRGPTPEARLHRRRLGVGPDEGLDAVGLGRRLALFGKGEPRIGALPFPPLSRVTFDPWLVAAEKTARPALDAVKEILDEAWKRREETFHIWCSPARDPERPIEESRPGYGRFRYDASFLMEGGLPALQRELEQELSRAPGAEEEIRQALDDLESLREPVAFLHGRLAVPPPYFGLLMMDGDGIGSRLKEAGRISPSSDPVDESEPVIALAEHLYRFADQAEDVVSRIGHGCAFFVGGDELAAYLPLDLALDTVRKLARLFSEGSEQHAGSDGPLTLSAGLAIGHLKDDLRATRRAATEALRDAKKGRRKAEKEAASGTAQPGWLAIRERPRSGEARHCAGPTPDLCADLDAWRDLLLADRLSLRTPRILHELGLRFRDERGHGGSRGLDLAKGRIRNQWERSGKDPAEEPADTSRETHLAECETRLVERLREAPSWEGLFRLADEIAIAGRIAKIHALREAKTGGTR